MKKIGLREKKRKEKENRVLNGNQDFILTSVKFKIGRLAA